MQKTFFVRFYILLVFLLVFSFGGAFVSNAQTLSQNPSGNAEVLASVSLESGKMNQVDRNFDLRILLKNSGSPISGIKTSVILLSEDLSQVLFEKSIDGQVSLGAGESKELSIPFEAPIYFSGKFRIGLRAQTQTNLPLGTFIFPRTVSLYGTNEGVFLDPQTCNLRVAGESAKKTYTLEQGVDILVSEKILLSCVAKNLGKTPLEVKASFDTYWRSQSGELISGGVLGSVFSFKAQESRRIEIPLITPTEPQAYDILVSLNGGTKDVSNKVRAHFVIRGKSATIQTFSLDKVSYKKGDIAQVTLVWTPSADSFPESRLGAGTPLANPAAFVSLSSEKGVCGSEISIPLSNDVFTANSSISIENDCHGVKALVRILDGEEELTSFNYDVPAPPKKLLSIENPIVLFGGILVLVILFIIGIAKIIRGRKNTDGSTNVPPYIPPIAGLILFLAFGFGFTASALAATVTWNDRGGNTLTGTVNIASQWNEGDSISFSGDFSNTYQYCGNGARMTITFGYEIRNSSNQVVSTASRLYGPFITQNIGQLPVGNYVLRSYFGDSNEYSIDHYEDSTCYESIDYDGDGIEDDSSPYDCQVPVYVITGLNGMATVDIPFTVNRIDKAPEGYHDTTSCSEITGWVFDADSESSVVDVHVYNGPAGGGGSFIGSYPASASRPDLVSNRGIGANHGFFIPFPESLKTGNQVDIYIYGIGVGPSGTEDGLNSILNGSPQSIMCAPVGPTLPPTVDLSANPVSVDSGDATSLSWTSTNATSCTASGGWSGNKALSGTQSSGPITGLTTFTLTCSNSVGDASDSVTINLNGTSADVCPNIAGEQTTVPSGHKLNGSGVCVPTQCNDGTDNDGDGRTDAQDPGCVNDNDDNETDGVNNVPGASITGPTILSVNEQGTWDYTASDIDGNLARWRFYAGTNQNPQWTGISGASKTAAYSTSFPVAGTYEWKLDVEDVPGLSASDSITVIVRNQGALPQCRDGMDNDGDAKTDFPQDPGCLNANDDDEDDAGGGGGGNPECSDLADNDGDGKIDFPQDPGCINSADDDEMDTPVQPPECSDLIDNDGNGFIDYPDDGGCTSPGDDDESGGPSFCTVNPMAPVCRSNPQCSDGVDNSDPEDTLIDMADPGCSNPSDNDETDGAGGGNPQCSDSIDNDGDGRTDYPNDTGCTDTDDDDESNSGGGGGPQCSDSSDNDGDGKIDFPQDPGCLNPSDDDEDDSGGGRGGNPECSDTADNDGDGFVDFPSDSGCSSPSDDTESNVVITGFTLDGTSLVPIKFGTSGSADSGTANLSVNPAGGFSSSVTVRVISILSQSTGAPLPMGTTATYSFAGKPFIANPVETMSMNASGSYVNEAGAVGLAVKVRISQKINEKYVVTLQANGGGKVDTHTVTIDPSLNPDFREI